MKTKLPLPAFLLSLFFFAGCTWDDAFRSRVESAEFTAAGTSDKAGNYGGTIGTKLTFRDPLRTTRDNK